MKCEEQIHSTTPNCLHIEQLHVVPVDMNRVYSGNEFIFLCGTSVWPDVGQKPHC